MTRVAVYGGGIVSMLMAILFHLRGEAVQLWRPNFDKSTKTRRVFALNQQAITTLENLGISTNALVSIPVSDMFIWDDMSGASIQFKASEVGRFYLTKIVGEHDLWQAIDARLQALYIPVVDAQSGALPEFRDSKWHLMDSAWADFLCIADGARSAVRDHLKVPCQSYSYKQSAIVAQVKVTDNHQATAFQVFGPFGPLAFLPISSQGDYSIVWSLDNPVAKAYMNLSVDMLKEKIYEALDGHLGTVVHIEGIQSYPLHMLHARQYVDKHWLLAGDTAHHFHPLAGLGLNMGIGDVACLWNLTQTKSFLQVLAMYQRQRKSSLTPVITGMQLFKNGFANQHPAWVKLRSLGMDFLDHQGLLKKIMMRMIQNI